MLIPIRLTKLHFLERSSLGLLDDKPRVDNEREIEDAEHQEGFPTQVVNGMGGNLGECEVEQPLCCGSDGDTTLTDPSRENL